MRPNSAHLIKDNAEADLRIDMEYSGRGMNGRTTYGVVFGSLAEFAHAVANAAAELEPGSMEVIDFCEDMRNTRFDDMGKGIIVY